MSVFLFIFFKMKALMQKLPKILQYRSNTSFERAQTYKQYVHNTYSCTLSYIRISYETIDFSCLLEKFHKNECFVCSHEKKKEYWAQLESRCRFLHGRNDVIGSRRHHLFSTGNGSDISSSFWEEFSSLSRHLRFEMVGLVCWKCRFFFHSRD